MSIEHQREPLKPEPTTEQKQRYALRQCYLLAIRMARKAQKADDSRSSEWNHIIRFCKDADEDGAEAGTPDPPPDSALANSQQFQDKDTRRVWTFLERGVDGWVRLRAPKPIQYEHRAVKGRLFDELFEACGPPASRPMSLTRYFGTLYRHNDEVLSGEFYRAEELEELLKGLTLADVEQVIEGIEHFIVAGDPAVDKVWQPYIVKLQALAALLPSEPTPR